MRRKKARAEDVERRAAMYGRCGTQPVRPVITALGLRFQSCPGGRGTHTHTHTLRLAWDGMHADCENVSNRFWSFVGRIVAENSGTLGLILPNEVREERATKKKKKKGGDRNQGHN